jgi:hypothetical protein
MRQREVFPEASKSLGLRPADAELWGRNFVDALSLHLVESCLWN